MKVMENPETRKTVEKTPEPKDISSEFLSMTWSQFDDFLRSQRKEPSLSIKIYWRDVPTARRLKAFLEDFDAISRGQKRFATIRATEEQWRQELNVFASGVKWEKVE
jgi:hypothetical protein